MSQSSSPGGYPPGRPDRDRGQEAIPEPTEGRATASQALIFFAAIVVALCAVFYGLSNSNKYPDFGNTYGGCSAQNDSQIMTLQCPDDAARHAALDEFIRKNSEYEISGIRFQKKKAK